ncbi:TRAP transporter permease [Comamonas sp. NoAH]|uniref:TRAP transporter permease n=1 Tax=Comamonas halotolerans TaxID=3041496 RepID=UPI0024E09CBE|nr:TRAP transporter permease [Comamonas sp. NoAH]
MATDIEKAPAALQTLVADSDTGGRSAKGIAAGVVFAISIFWALFQLWQASPLPFALRWGVLNDTEARSIHLGLALFLAFLAFPAWRSERARQSVPWFDWVLAATAAFAGSFLFTFYNELASRPGQPSTLDIVTGTAGLLLLLEATRRAVGWPMAALAIVFIAYCLLGPWMPDVLSHKGASFNRLLSQMWLGTEGVFGVALGVSSSTIFVYVLFGALLDRAGGGNYMMQVSFAALGHLRGGPAKVAVVSSGLNGLISGSSVSNVVSGGIFTIPLMKKAGYGGVKAAAIETMSSTNGQIMPPVMGAAAFLMVEYVGIPYSEVCKHAFLPAVLSYIGLFYIVHLEALKLGIEPMVQPLQRTLREKALRTALGCSGTLVLVCFLYFVLEAAKSLLGDYAGWAVGSVMLVLYLTSIRMSAREPDLPEDIDVSNPKRLDTWSTVKAGTHFLLPIGTLIWALMVEELSPALAAFWAVMVMLVLMTTQHALQAWLRKSGDVFAQLRVGVNDVVQGLNAGSRNMIGVAIATGTAGIIVGAISLTGLGLRMTEFVEFVAQGNVLLMLLFTAFVCLVLGLGVPTTANYVLVATLMAPVVVELGAQNGLIIPLIAVHLFVFYYGLLGDVTPPVGLATFAGAAIAQENAIRVGIQGALYGLRTVILPFIWIFNPALLLFGVNSWTEIALVAFASLLAMLAFTAITMNWMRVRCKPWELVMLALATVLLFRPDFFMDRIAPAYSSAPATQIYEIAKQAPAGASLVAVISGMTLEGDERTKTVSVPLGEPNDSAHKRIADTGLQLMALGDTVQISAVRFGSAARKAGFEEGFDITSIQLPTHRPSPYWFYLPGVLLLIAVWWLQGRRMESVSPPKSTSALAA